MFFKTRAPVEPVSFVEKICQDAAAGVQSRNCPYVKRLTPITALEKATAKGLEVVAEKVLAPHFHGPDQAGKKVSLPRCSFAAVYVFQMPYRILTFGSADTALRNSSRLGHQSVITRNLRETGSSRQSQPLWGQVTRWTFMATICLSLWRSIRYEETDTRLYVTCCRAYAKFDIY